MLFCRGVIKVNQSLFGTISVLYDVHIGFQNDPAVIPRCSLEVKKMLQSNSLSCIRVEVSLMLFSCVFEF